MPDRMFLDTNVLVYAFLENDRRKHEQAIALLTSTIRNPFA